MKKHLLLAMCLVTLTVNAQVFVENFATAPIGGNVEGYNAWYLCAKAADALGVSPKIAEGALFYNGYVSSNIGNVAVLDSAVGVTSATQRISTKTVKFGSDTLRMLTGDKIYTAFLVNVSSHSYRSYRDFFTYEGSATSSMTRGRVFAKNNAAGDAFTLALSKNSSQSGVYVEYATPLATGINHLLVFCYEVVDGTDNDKLSLYINPDLTKSEAEQTEVINATDVASDYSATAAIGINLRQRGIGAQIGGIRVAKSWSNALTSGLSQALEDRMEIKVVGKTVHTNSAGILTVYNLIGSEMLSSKTQGVLKTALNSGIYLVRFRGVDGKTAFGKIAIQ
ncbi:MAG TPA: hypothetical protein VFP20_10705 [Bacteroidales bacterium]|nr:hypothetical protein [Bacteroidales bacterium]